MSTKLSKVLTLASVTLLMSFNSTFSYAETQKRTNANDEKLAQYKDFPTEENGILNAIMNMTNIPVTPNNVVERSERGGVAVEKVVQGMQGMGFNFLVKKSDCVAWINLYRASFAGGARIGRGMASCRLEKDPNKWSAPFYMILGGVSGGLQLGLDQSDYFLFFPEKSTLMNVLDGNIRLDGNAGLTVAQWGRSLSIGTDIELSEAEIQSDVVYTYAVSRGVYAGISLEGGMILGDDRYNERTYRTFSAAEIFSKSQGKAPKATRAFSKVLEKISKEDLIKGDSSKEQEQPGGVIDIIVNKITNGISSND